MTRFIHVDRPMAYPFFDVVLRDTNPGGCFDLSVLLEDFTGSLYVRDEHITEMARSLGMATRSEFDELKAENARLKAQIERLPAAQEELKDGLANLVSKFHTDLLGIDTEPSVGDKESDESGSIPAETEREAVGPFSL